MLSDLPDIVSSVEERQKRVRRRTVMALKDAFNSFKTRYTETKEFVLSEPLGLTQLEAQAAFGDDWAEFLSLNSKVNSFLDTIPDELKGN